MCGDDPNEMLGVAGVTNLSLRKAGMVLGRSFVAFKLIRFPHCLGMFLPDCLADRPALQFPRASGDDLGDFRR